MNRSAKYWIHVDLKNNRGGLLPEQLLMNVKCVDRVDYTLAEACRTVYVIMV